jgi:uncharacterized protein YciI
MYAVILRYKVPLAEVEKHLEAHRVWLQKHYAAGHFLLSGPQRPRTGGFILAAPMERSQLDGILSEDEFHKTGAADYEVINFAPASTGERLAFLAETP